MPNTKIVATLGPSSDAPEVQRQMIATGVSVFRLNASHGSQPEHERRMRSVRALAANDGKQIAILLDLCGPKIRLGKFETEGCAIPTGAEFVITTEPIVGNCDRASTTYPNFAKDVKPGDRVLLADGAVVLEALETDGKSVRLWAKDHEGSLAMDATAEID